MPRRCQEQKTKRVLSSLLKNLAYGHCGRSRSFNNQVPRISTTMMNRAFGFTDRLRQNTRANNPQQKEGGQNEIRSLESWQMAEGVQGPQRGPTGPPRDLTFRRIPPGEQENFQAGNRTFGRATMLTFGNTRGPPGLGFKPITQETSPKQGPGNQGSNHAPATTTGDITMWAQAPGQQGVQDTHGPQPTGLPPGTTGAGVPAEAHTPNASAMYFGQAVPGGREDNSPPRPYPKEGQRGTQALRHASRNWDNHSMIPSLYAGPCNGNGTSTGKPQR
jgi:hypothetical protein